MNKKVLVADDNFNNLKFIGDILQAEGFTVYTADTSQAVLEKASELKPDVILLDVMMPGPDGFELCRRLKGNEEVRDIPVIMVSDKTKGTDLKKAFENGAVDFIKKPVDEIEVIARIKSALRYKESRDQLLEKASRDSLTGIYTHAMLLEQLEREVNRMDREASALAYIMLDVDFFKRINDTYGHQCGDAILKGISGILTDKLRKVDIIGRYGGEEFGLVIPKCGKSDIVRICDRIRSNIEEHLFRYKENTIRVTVSMGAYFREAGDKTGTEDIVKKADDALYLAKSGGRNRVEIVSSTG